MAPPPKSRLLTDLDPKLDNGDLRGLSDAIVLRGYYGAVALPTHIAKWCAGNADADKVVADLRKKYARLYLSARLDQYVDFQVKPDAASVLLHWAATNPDDDSVTVWLKEGVYPIVTEASIRSGTTDFVRGELVDDFMSQPEAQVAWDEQRPGSAKLKSGIPCAH